jgi:thymidylate kinase
MMILVEGIDKAGKSTIVKDLDELFEKKAIILKLSQKPKDNSHDEIMKAKVAYSELFYQAKQLSEKGQIVIFDRAYPSEMVYSIKRGYDAMKDSFWWNFDEDLSHMSNDNELILIYCSTDPMILAERFVSKGEQFAKQEEIPTLLERYENFLAYTKVSFIRVDSMRDRLANIVTIKDLIKRNK